MLFTFSVFDWEYPSEANFIREAEVWYLVISNMQNSCRSLFSNFDQIYIFFLGKFGPKNQNCQFKLKFGM